MGKRKAEKPVRKRPLIIVWLDNLGIFYPLIDELELANVAAAFEGGTAVRCLIGAVPSVTESAEIVVKTGCGMDRLPVLGEVTFDRASRQHVSLKKQMDFDRETGRLTPVKGAPRLADFVSPALARRLISNLGFSICQIGWKLGQVGAGRVVSLESEEAIRLEQTASYDIIPLRIQALLQAMQDHEADLYLLNISGDSIVHDHGLGGQALFMKRLDKEFPALMDGLAARAEGFTLIMFSDHGPRPVQGHLEPEEFLADIPGLNFAGAGRNSAVVSNGRGSLYLYVRNLQDSGGWRPTAYRQLRDYGGHDLLAAIADRPARRSLWSPIETRAASPSCSAPARRRFRENKAGSGTAWPGGGIRWDWARSRVHASRARRCWNEPTTSLSPTRCSGWNSCRLPAVGMS